MCFALWVYSQRIGQRRNYRRRRGCPNRVRMDVVLLETTHLWSLAGILMLQFLELSSYSKTVHKRKPSKKQWEELCLTERHRSTVRKMHSGSTHREACWHKLPPNCSQGTWEKQRFKEEGNQRLHVEWMMNPLAAPWHLLQLCHAKPQTARDHVPLHITKSVCLCSCPGCLLLNFQVHKQSMHARCWALGRTTALRIYPAQAWNNTMPHMHLLKDFIVKNVNNCKNVVVCSDLFQMSQKKNLATTKISCNIFHTVG